MANAVQIPLTLDKATLIHTAGRLGAHVCISVTSTQLSQTFFGGANVDATHGANLGAGTIIDLTPGESLYAFADVSGAVLVVLVTGE